MIQRTLLRQSRALGSAIRPSPRASLVQTPFKASNTAFAASRQVAASRWYATEPEAKKEGEAAAEAGAEKPTEEDACKKELEAKKAEVIDLKVCPATPLRTGRR
jgi:molecular chaperone GrpE